jgi:hypothetical protein
MIGRSPSQSAATSRKRSATPGQLHVTLGALVLEGGLGKVERQWQSNTAWEPQVSITRRLVPVSLHGTPPGRGLERSVKEAATSTKRSATPSAWQTSSRRARSLRGTPPGWGLGVLQRKRLILSSCPKN